MKKEDEKLVSLKVQLGVAVFLTLSGTSLMFMGFWVNPLGIISESVLVAFGEIMTFAGALFGIDYRYRFNHLKFGGQKNEATDSRNAKEDDALRQ